MERIAAFMARSIRQHARPVNASLHLVGVPMLAVGLYRLAPRGWRAGLTLIAFSHTLQCARRSIRGTEVGEVTPIRRLLKPSATNRRDHAMRRSCPSGPAPYEVDPLQA